MSKILEEYVKGVSLYKSHAVLEIPVTVFQFINCKAHMNMLYFKQKSSLNKAQGNLSNNFGYWNYKTFLINIKVT